MSNSNAEARRVRFAELMSGLGAGVLGVGLGALLANYLSRYAIFILFAGLLTHAWGMTEKHRIENRTEVRRLWWAALLYWICWVVLIAVAAFVLVGR